MPKTYRQRVLELAEAMEITPETIARAVSWSRGVEVSEIAHDGQRLVGLNVPTVREIIRVSEGEFLVLLRGSFMRMDADEFNSKYELVSP